MKHLHEGFGVDYFINDMDEKDARNIKICIVNNISEVFGIDYKQENKIWKAFSDLGFTYNKPTLPDSDDFASTINRIETDVDTLGFKDLLKILSITKKSDLIKLKKIINNCIIRYTKDVFYENNLRKQIVESLQLLESRAHWPEHLMDEFNNMSNSKVLESHPFDYGVYGLVEYLKTPYEVIIVTSEGFGVDIDVTDLKYERPYPKQSPLVTRISELLSNLKTVGKVLTLWSFAQGLISVCRYDGNVYMVICRPTSLIGRDYPFGQFKDHFGKLLKKKGQYVYGHRLKDIKLNGLL